MRIENKGTSKKFLTMVTVLMLGTIIALSVASSWLKNDGMISTPNSHYEYIIGTAGCVLASGLANSPGQPSVLLVEAGDHFPWWASVPLAAPLLQRTTYDWAYQTVPQLFSSWGLTNQTSAWPRGRGLGGSGQMNYLLHFSGSEKDFRLWKQMGVHEWNYNDIQILLDRLLGKSAVQQKDGHCSYSYQSLLTSNFTDLCAEGTQTSSHSPKLHITRVNPKESVLSKAFMEAGKELKKSGNWNLSFITAESTVKSGQRWSTYHGFLKPTLGKSNLHVLTKNLATKVLFDTKKKAIGIEMIDSTDHNINVFASSEIILCAGVINSPKILLHSGIGPHQHLTDLGMPTVANLPVGLGLHDHLNVPMFVSISKPVSVTFKKIFQFSQLWKYIKYGKGYLSSTSIAAVGSSLPPDIGVVLFAFGSVEDNIMREIANFKQKTFHALFPFSGNKTHEGFVLLPSCLQPLSRGFV